MAQCAWRGADDMNLTPFVPYPGSELYREMVTDGRIPPMSEEYFVSLLDHSLMNKVKSFNRNFGPGVLLAIRLTFISSFYLVSFMTHPAKALRFVRNLWRRIPETRIERNLIQLSDRLRQALT